MGTVLPIECTWLSPDLDAPAIELPRASVRGSASEPTLPLAGCSLVQARQNRIASRNLVHLPDVRVVAAIFIVAVIGVWDSDFASEIARESGTILERHAAGADVHT